MQTTRGRSRALEVPQKSSCLVAPRTSRDAKSKTHGSDSDSISPQSTSKTPKERSPKIIEHKSPLEKKRLGRMSELESQVAQLQDDLKKTMEQLSCSNSSKRQALANAEEMKKQLLEISGAEEDRVRELRKISHDRDLAWQSELEAVQRQHMMDTSALASALNDIQKLQAQLEMVAGSEQSARAEIHSLEEELGVRKESEARVLDQLESAKKNEKVLRSDVFKTMEAYDSVSAELERSRALVHSLERNQKPDVFNGSDELDLVKAEAEELRSALEENEARFQEEYIKSTLQIRSAYEQIECAKSESYHSKAEWKAESNQARIQIEDLKAKLMDKETELQGILEENEELNLKIQSSTTSEADLVAADMKHKLKDMEMKLQIKMEETETLKKMNTTGNQNREARVMEQLDVAQAMNSHLETELRRLKVQSDQWRKAAEAAATMLSPDYNGRFNGSNTRGFDGRTNSLALDDDSDDESKKSNGKMLKKFGVLWKKGHHQK